MSADGNKTIPELLAEARAQGRSQGITREELKAVAAEVISEYMAERDALLAVARGLVKIQKGMNSLDAMAMWKMNSPSREFWEGLEEAAAALKALPPSIKAEIEKRG